MTQSDRTMNLIAPLVIASLVAIPIWLWWRISSTRVKTAKKWPLTEATITSGRFETFYVDEASARLPAFDFYYCVGSSYYSGRFTLRPYTVDMGESLIARMIGRRLQIHFNPAKPEYWFVPDELIEGCKVEQKLGIQIFNFAPRE